MNRNIALLGLVSLLLAGCMAPSAPTKEEMADFTPVNIKLSFDDPKPVFAAAFPSDLPLRKDRLETEAEYKTRLAAIGIQGKVYTFLVPPELCEVQPFPEQGFYVITSRDTYYTGYNPRSKPYGITVAKTEAKTDQYVGQNAYGAKADVSMYSATFLQVAPLEFFKLPRPLRWKPKENSVLGSFGLSIRIVDPAFRKKLREKKIGLAIRVRVGDLSLCDVDYQHISPTITNPAGLSFTKPLLPATLLAAWIVDTETNTSLVEWRNGAEQ